MLIFQRLSASINFDLNLNFSGGTYIKIQLDFFWTAILKIYWRHYKKIATNINFQL
ncbi:hypothetical protein NIES4071_108380 (plasmid) [Calothrix sp. NIES-4071]|nr:hypothetical protein NIES4071_108380 [Calothrix sp. NIES-4071]BAZ64878.1 hypothetical protein NIES4105_106110 [Calothrix sp. NIES-4105]